MPWERGFVIQVKKTTYKALTDKIWVRSMFSLANLSKAFAVSAVAT